MTGRRSGVWRRDGMQGQFGSPPSGSVRYMASQAVCIDLSKIGFQLRPRW